MSSLSNIQFSRHEAESAGTLPDAPAGAPFEQQADGLVPAEQLPPAADVLAQLFPPEESSIADSSAVAPNASVAAEGHSDEESDSSPIQIPADPLEEAPEDTAATHRAGRRKLPRFVARARKLLGRRKARGTLSEIAGAGLSAQDVPQADALQAGVAASAVDSPKYADPPAEVTGVADAPALDFGNLPSEKSTPEMEARQELTTRQEPLCDQIPVHDVDLALPEIPATAESPEPVGEPVSEGASPGFIVEEAGRREADCEIGAGVPTTRDEDNGDRFQQSNPEVPNFSLKEASAGESAAAGGVDEETDTSDDHAAIVAAIENYANRTDPVLNMDSTNGGELVSGGSQKTVPNESLERPSVFHTEPDGQQGDSVPGCGVPSNLDAESTGISQVSAASPEPQSGEEPAAAASFAPSDRDWSFEEKLASHLEWVQSRGTTGRKADLSGAELEGTELIGVNLRFADLHDANLRAADLLMADLRDACLVRTNFHDACLVGANLEAANLEGASLDTAMGLVPRQLAGTNLHEASLPPQIAEFESRAEFERTARTVYAFFVSMISASALSWALLWSMKDVQLLTNASVLPFLHSQGNSGALPAGQICLVAPFALFILYLVFHFQLQHLWDLTLELPAVFPDGRSLDENKPRIVAGLLRNHFRWMNSDAPSTRTLEKAISVFTAYWIVPATLLLFWLRYLTLQEIHGSIFQELLVAAAAGAALNSTNKVGRPEEKWTLQKNFAGRLTGRIRGINPVKAAFVFLGVLTFLSAGVMFGVPHGKDRAPQYHAWSIRRWAATGLWAVGFDPYPNLIEAVISIPPPGWNGSDDQVASVKGARLNESNFRYAQAYRIFLANAHLWHTDFQGAFLSQADFRRADLGQSRLQFAILDQAEMNHANLDRSVLDGANLSRADLRGANLSYASLDAANLVDARLDGATLYGARMRSATLIRTNFEKADLRDASMAGANLEHADLQGAYLWSAKLPGAHLNNAQLGAAILVDADLRGADLRWSQLPGAILTGADLTGASLDGADLRGAVGFGASQVCSAKTRKGLLLDPAMQDQVNAQCGAR
jgi:uncharacterized protein YjbI with pentapeptide repeats